MKRTQFILSLIILSMPLFAQQKSAKRGMCWDEKTQVMSEATIQKMAPGVSWIYNWGATPKNEVANLEPDKEMAFFPMCWNAAFNETALRTYLTNHPGVKYLLGFNEPNFSTQASMTPAAAVAAWPRLEQIAADFNLELVAPALNFTNQQVGGRQWDPFDWYDEFFRLYPTARVDYLAMHCYMNWAKDVDWLSSRYFYTGNGATDLYTDTVKVKYPNLVKFLDDYKAANGHFPKMFLTEFCSWEDWVYPNYDGLTVDFQIDQMTQKLQYLEKSDLVAGYAWFMANPSGGVSEHPHESIFQTNTAVSELSDLGKVYVYMSSFDTEKYYASGEQIMAKDYVDASMDNQQVKVRPNTETGSEIPLQVEFPNSAWATYQISVAGGGPATLTLHMKSSAAGTIGVYVDGFSSAKRVFVGSVPSTSDAWEDKTVTLTKELSAGQHTISVWNGSSSSMYLNALKIDVTTGISEATLQTDGERRTNRQYDNAVYDLTGRKVADNYQLSIIKSQLPKGIYIYKGKKLLVK